MIDQKLIDYVSQQLRNGHDVNTIRNALIQQGWNRNTVDDSINSVYNPNTNQNINIAKQEGSEKMADKKQVPTGVKVISVLYYIGAVLGVIFGILFLVGAGMMGPIAKQIPLLGSLGAGLFVVGGIVMIGFGVLGFFIGRGLWKTRPWARIVVIIFAALGVLMAVISMIQGNIISNIFGLVFNLAIGGYLFLSGSVKEAFA